MADSTHPQAAVEGALTEKLRQAHDLSLDGDHAEARGLILEMIAALPTAQGQAAPVVPEPVAHVPADALAKLAPPCLVVWNVPLYSYAFEGSVALYAVPAVPLPSEQSAQSQGACPAGTAEDV